MKTDAMMMNVCMAFMMLLSASTVQAAKEPYCLQPCKNACYAKKDCDSYKKPIRCTRRCDKKCDKKIAKEGCPTPPCLAPCISACESDKGCASKSAKKAARCTKRCTKKCLKKFKRKGCPKTPKPTSSPLEQGDHPELDDSEELLDDDIKKYQSLIEILIIKMCMYMTFIIKSNCSNYLC